MSGLCCSDKHHCKINYKKCGSFYHGIFSDHRAVYIDIKTTDLFQRAHPDTNRQIYKRFTTAQAIKCEKFIHTLEKHLSDNKIDKKVQILKGEMIKLINTGEGKESQLIQKCKTLFEKTTQVMKASKRSLGGKAYSHGYPSSKF